jgi:DNA modification methylase
MTATILRGAAAHLPLADESVDLIVTSPPYWALRSYTDGGEHYAGQIGAEPTPAEYIDSLIDCTREWMRVLKPTGSLWVNLGDKYATGATPGPQSSSTTMTGGRHKGVSNVAARKVHDGVPGKSLIGLPWRYALRCIDDLGLILRAEVIWSKPNGLPESVTDRVRRSHETWFHLVKSPRYFSAVDTIREPHEMKPQRRGVTVPYGDGTSGAQARLRELRATPASDGNPLGKLPGSVWEIATQPLIVPADLGIDHFAAFPMEWPRRIILGWSPSGVCTACGEGRRPVVARQRMLDGVPIAGARFIGPERVEKPNGFDHNRFSTDTRITGEACVCPDTSAPTRPSVILDPFGGTGTAALVAHAYGRHGISVDMSADYCRLAAWRTTDPGQLAAALEVEKPTPPLAGQLELFGAVTAG